MQRGARIGHGHNTDLDHFILVMFIHVIKGQIESRRVFFVIQNTFNFQSWSRGVNILYFHRFYLYFWYFTVSAWLFSRQQIKYGSYFFRYLYDITTWDDDMTWRCHETCSGHSGVMSRAAWQRRDTTWRDCNKCSQCHCLAIVQFYYCLQYWSLLNMMRTFHEKSWTDSFSAALNTRSGVRVRYQVTGALWSPRIL